MSYLLHHLISESAQKHPDKEAIVLKGHKMSYGRLEEESNRLAHALLAMGSRRGDRIGIHLYRSIDAIVGLLGILKTGAAYVPLDPSTPPARFEYMVNKCGIRFLLTSREKLVPLESTLSACPSLVSVVIMNGLDADREYPDSPKLVDWIKARDQVSYSAPEAGAVDRDLAYILFTSGSTGNPKGVMISHLNSLTFVDSAYDFFSIAASDIFSNICPLHFDMSVFDLFVAFKAGATVAIIPEATATFPVELAKFIEKNGVTIWNSVPSALSLLANLGSLPNYDLSSLRLVLFAGEVFPVKYLRRLRAVVPGASFYNIYGQTEANSSTFFHVKETPSDDEAVLPIGRPFPNFDVFALDDEGRQICKSGEKGELYVRASSVALGYWDDVERTNDRFVIDPLKPYTGQKVYRTGDLVSLDEEGNYTFLGRKDHMIKSRGYRIEIGEIETALSTHEGIKNAVVIPIPDHTIGNRIAAVIVPLTKGGLEKEDVLRYCGIRLPRYMIPEIIEFRDSLPMTSSGKIDRKNLGGALSETTNPAAKENEK